MKTKLPKQWRDWCSTMRLKPIYKRGQAQYQWFYLVGRGHMWRVNCHGMFERGDTYAEFDRLVLCDIKSVPVPITKSDFRMAVNYLLEKQ